MMTFIDRIGRPGPVRRCTHPTLAARLLPAVLAGMLLPAALSGGMARPAAAGPVDTPATPVQHGPQTRKAGAVARRQSKELDYSGWNALLARYVRVGRVDYAAWKKEGTRDLDSVLVRMAAYPYDDLLAHETRLAFLVNAYNAYAIRAILDAYPVRSVKEIPGFMDELKHPLAGGRFTLEEIQKILIRGKVDDKPEYHFALVWGAAGCGPLRGNAYTADSMLVQGADQLRRFMAVPGNCRFDEATRTLHVSEIFKWNAADFEKGDQTIPAYVAPGFSLSDAVRIMREEPHLEFEPFDWSLNDAGATGGPR